MTFFHLLWLHFSAWLGGMDALIRDNLMGLVFLLIGTLWAALTLDFRARD